MEGGGFVGDEGVVEGAGGGEGGEGGVELGPEVGFLRLERVQGCVGCLELGF